MKNLLFICLLCLTTNVWAQNCGATYTITKSGDSICANTPITFTIQGLAPGFSNIEWDFGGGWQSGSNPQSHTFPHNNSTQTYTVTFRAWAGTPILAYECGQTTVTIKATPVANLTTTSLLFCNTTATQTVTVTDASNAPSGSTYTINWGDGNQFPNSTTAPVSLSHQFTTLGYKYIVETVSLNGCSDSKTYTYYNGTNPAVSMGNPGGTVGLCAPSIISFPITGITNNSPGTIYKVYVNNVLDTTYTHPPPANYTHNFTSSSCGFTSPNGSNNSYSIKIEASNPCDNSLVVVEPVRVSIRPTANFTYTPNLCPNTPVTFTNTSTGEDVRNGGCTSPAIQWTLSGTQGIDWTINSGSIAAPSSNVVTTTFLHTGTYTMCLTASSQICSTNSICKSIVVLTAAQAEAQANTSYFPNPICKDAVFNLNSNGSIGVAPLNYNWMLLDNSFNPISLPSTIWHFNGTSTDSSPNPAITITQAGTYWAKLTLSNTCNTDTALVKLRVIDKPTVTLDPISNFCITGNPSFNSGNVHFSNGGATTTYNWSITGVQPSTQQYPSFSNLPIGTYTVTVTATNICGSASATRSFSVIQQGAVTITIPSHTICVGDTIILISSPSSGVWSANAPAGVFIASTAGTYLIKYKLTGTCSDSTSTNIIVQNRPTATATSATVCAGATATLTASGGGTYAWSTTPVTTTASLIIPTTAATPASTSYTVTVTNTQGCKAKATGVLTVKPLPVITMTAASICNTNTSLNLNTAMTVQPSGGVWSPTSAFLTAGGVFNAQAAGTAGSPYSVIYTATVNGCTSSDSAQVTVTSNQPASAGTNKTICKNETLSLGLLGTPAGGVWSGVGVVNNVFDGLASGVVIGGSGNVLTYTVGAGNALCQTSSTMVVTVNDIPTPNLTAANTCVGTTLSLMATGGGSYNWEGPNGFAQNIANPTITPVTAVAGGVYTVTVTGINTCKNTQSTTVEIYTLPVISLTAMTQCQNITLFDLNTSNPTPSGGVWSGAGVSSGHLFDVNQAVSPPVYAVVYTFTNANSCVNSGSTTVSILTNNSPSAGIDRAICTNGGLVNMDSIPFGTPIGGVWSGVGVANNVFNPAIAGVGVHSLIYTKGAGECAKSDTMLFTVKALPKPHITSNRPCAGDNLCFITTVDTVGGHPLGSTYAWSGPNSFAPTVQNPCINSVQMNALGAYTITVTGANGCKDTAMNTAIVYSLPNTHSNDTTYCRTVGCYNLPFVSISDTLGTFVWSSWNAAAQSAINTGAMPPCFSPLISGNSGAGQAFPAVVTLTDTHGCIGRDTVNITVAEPAHLALSPMIDTVCSGINVVLHALPAGGHWYRASVGFPDLSITQDSIVNTASLIGGGNFTYTYSYGEGSCHVKDSVRIFVIALDTISAGGNDSFCINRLPFQLIGQTPSNYTPATAHWENAHTNSAGVDIQNQGITSTGFYTPYAVAGADSSEVIIDTVKFVYTDPVRGCPMERTKIITIHPLPVPANTIPAVGCIGTPISFINNSLNIASSVWNFGDGTTSTVNSPTHNYIDTGRYQVHLEVASAFGCRASVTDSIHIVAPPYISFTMSHDSICTGLPVTMINGSSGYQVNYIWNYGDGTPNDNVFAPPPHRFAPRECDTIYPVTLTAYNLCASVPTTRLIKIFPLPVPKWERTDSTLCSGQIVGFINNTKICNTDTYEWTIDGVAWTTDRTPADQAFYTNTLPHTYNLCLNAHGKCGSSMTCKKLYVIPTQINAFFNKNKDRGCRPLSVDFTQSSSLPSTGVFTYAWNFGDGSTSSLPNPTHVFDSPTRDTFHVILYVSDGCNIDTAVTTIYTFPQPRLSFTHPPYQCAEQGMTFTNTSLDPITSIWNFGDGGSSSATNPIHAFAQAGYHTVTLIGKSLTNGCPDTTIQQVLIRENPLITPTVTPSDGCGPLLVTFTTAGAPASFDYYYTWNFGDGGTAVDTAHVAIAQSVQHLYAKRDSITRFHVGLTVIDKYQCKSDTLYSPIVLYPTPTADFAYTLDPSCGVNTVASFINASTSTAGNLRYTWDFGDHTVGSHDDNPTHQYLNSSGKTVTLTAENTYNCADSVQHRLEYCDGLYIPSAFSPEIGLGEVRLFGAKGLGIKQYRLAVYSRFGDLMWETDKLEQGLPVERWDGRFNGQLVPQDMYIWKCEAVFENGNIWQGQEDASHKLQRVGTVTVLR